MTNAYGIEVKGIEFHYLCGHRAALMEPLPEFDPTMIDDIYLGVGDVIRFSDMTPGHELCGVCRMNERWKERNGKSSR